MILTLCLCKCSDAPESRSFVESLITTIMSNLQVFVHNVHIRYEDSSLRSDSSFACGLCIQNISIETTNRYVFFFKCFYFICIVNKMCTENIMLNIL